MPSKLGPHCLRPTGSAKQMMDAGARIVKLVDDFGSAHDFLARPGVTLIGRSYSNFTAESQRGENPEAAARRFIDSQKEKYRLNPAVKLWEGHNEPVWGGREDMEWYAKFEIARLKLLADLGLRGVVASFATGNPGDIELWRWFIPAVQAAKQRNGVLGLHEYSSPWVWWMTGRYQFNPNEDAGDEGWTTLRYRKVMHKFLKPEGCDDVQIAITEFGLDRVSPVPPGASSGNWRTNAEWWGRWDGSRDPIPYWRGGNRDAETYYAEQMIWYDREIRKDANVLGATIFTLGSSNSAWDHYNIDGTRVAQYLIDYIRREANVQDSASTASGTVTQPTNPTEPEHTSPIVVTGPTTGTTLGINLLRNPNLEDGSFHWHGINEINIPNGWDFWYQTDKQLRLDRQDQAFDPPECVVWHKASAPLEERSLFFLSGDHCMKIFKGWGVIWWRLFQTVDGLVPGQRYRFTAPVFPDLVMKYDLQKGKTFADDPLAGEVRLSARSGGREVETGWLNGNQFPFGKYTFFTLDFVAEGTSAEVSLECRGRWGVVNNGWFIDSLILEAIGPAPISKETSTQPTDIQRAGLVMRPGDLNLLLNPEFSAGTFQPNPAVRNLEAPRNWEFWSANESTAKAPKQTETFRPPRAAIVTAANAQVDDRDGLTAGVQRFYRVVGNWRALWFSLSQKVSVLTLNVSHRFSVKLMPDPVDKYLPPNNAKKFVADPDGGEVWLKVQSGTQRTETYKRINADFQPGNYITFTHEFTPTAREVTVTVEIRARFALTQNAWYLASARLMELETAPTDGNKTTTDTTNTSAVTIPASRGVVRGPVGRRGLSGELRLFVPDKFRYASQIENIKLYELITNTIGQRMAYGVIGVEIISRATNEKNFHTSFSGDLHIGPHCTGPRDECGGEWLDQIRIERAGKYGLALAICYNSVQDALAGRGDWETLTPYIEIEVDNWRP